MVKASRGCFLLVAFLCCYPEVFASSIKEIWMKLKNGERQDPEVNMNPFQLITSKGYPCEEYLVNTTDGYKLGIQRIPYGRKEKVYSPRPVIFVQHGLLASSTNWLTNLVNQSLAYILADAGYDVWLGNNRGNTYSRGHDKYDPSQDEFWAFSWYEMAEYDIPAMINFALATSKQSQLYYAGHSQGTLQMFAHLSKYPDFNKKIKTFFAMGPVTTVGHITSPLRLLEPLEPILFDLFGRKDFLPNNEIIDWLADHLCDGETKFLCADLLFVIAGFDRKQLNETRLPVYLSHTPAGTSVQDIKHFAQMVKHGQFQAFDYGSADRNKAHYGQPTPPIFHQENVTAPTVLFWADNDWLADPKDIEENILPKLPNIVHSCEISQWDHLDFIWAMDAANVVYDKIVQIMQGKGQDLCKK